MARSPSEPAENQHASALLRERVRAVFRHLPKGLAGHQESVHQMRVAGRRLRIALPLLAVRADGRRTRQALRLLRELTRAAGRSRDLDVSLRLFEEGLSLPTPEQLILRRRLRAARSRSRARMAEALMDLDIARLRRHLRRIVARGADHLFSVFLRLREKREAEGAALIQGFQTLGERFDPVALHSLRRRARRLRYAAELSDALRDDVSRAPALFKRFQEDIGAVHDRVVLAAWLQRQTQAATGRGQVALAEEARNRQASLLAAGRAFHRAFLEHQPAAAAEEALAVMRRSPVPLLVGGTSA